MSPDPFTVALMSQLGIAGFQGIKAITDANSFEGQEQPSYRDSSQELLVNRNLAKNQMMQGMSPEAKALGTNTFNTQQAGSYRAATENSGGQLSNAISRMGALNNINFGLNLGAQDQAARERGQSAFMGVNQQLQGQRDRDTGIAVQNYAQTRQNIQKTSGDALANLANAVTGYATGSQNQKYLDYLTKKGAETDAGEVIPKLSLPNVNKGLNFAANTPISLSAIPNPSVGQTAYANQKSWMWDGAKWNEVK